MTCVSLILWDLAGEDDISSLRTSYLRGSAGYVLVADGTRPSTLEVALSLRRRVEADLGPLPFVLLLNKNDLREQWAIGDAELEDLRRNGWWVQSTSARTGEGVEDAFKALAVPRRALSDGRSTRDCSRAAASPDLSRAGGGLSAGRCGAHLGLRRRKSRGSGMDRQRGVSFLPAASPKALKANPTDDPTVDTPS